MAVSPTAGIENTRLYGVPPSVLQTRLQLMDTELYNLHLRAGLLCGKEKTCEGKNSFETEDTAQRAANAHNRWVGRRHDVEPYPCAFCFQWHTGRIMTKTALESLVADGGDTE